MTEMQIDAVTNLPIETSHGISCGNCMKHLERRVRHANVAAVRECYRRTAIEIEIDATRIATELADARRITSPIVPPAMHNAPIGW
jgi:hypothetical protein